jgi:hypothetical protein
MQVQILPLPTISPTNMKTLECVKCFSCGKLHEKFTGDYLIIYEGRIARHAENNTENFLLDLKKSEEALVVCNNICLADTLNL